MPTTASGKGRFLGTEWSDDDLITDVERPTPAAALVVNDWFWFGAPAVAVIPWTWLEMPLELRVDPPVNSVQITGANSVVASVTNAASQAAYGTFSATATLSTTSTVDAANFATFLTTYYGNPLLRAPLFRFGLHQRLAEERWRILGREIGDRFTLGPGIVQDFPGHTITVPVPAGLPAAAQSLVIEGVSHTSSVTSRIVTWTTAPLLGASPGVEGPWFRAGYSFTDGLDGSVMPF